MKNESIRQLAERIITRASMHLTAVTEGVGVKFDGSKSSDRAVESLVLAILTEMRNTNISNETVQSLIDMLLDRQRQILARGKVAAKKILSGT